MLSQVTVYQCLEGGVIAALQSYVDEDVRGFTTHWTDFIELSSSLVQMCEFGKY